ncbi:MAG: site-specific integrase, partial [Clostridia bacterium]
GILREQEQVCLEQCLKTFFPNKEALGIYLCLYTGLRVGELCGLRWEDIDLENAILYVRRTVQRIVSNDSDKKTKIAIGPPKSFSSLREIPIPYHVLSLLRQSDQGAGNTYFLSNTTHCFEPRRMQRAFYRFLEKAGLSRRGFHCTRHTFATRWIEIGADIKTLSEILGHNSIQITLDKYVHISEKTKRENMNKIRPLCAEKPLYSDHQKVLLIPSGAGVL